GTEFVEQLRMDQVDLAEIRSGGILGDSGAVLDGGAHVGIAFHPEPFQEPDGRTLLLAEVVALVGADGHDNWWHRPSERNGRSSSRRPAQNRSANDHVLS